MGRTSTRIESSPDSAHFRKYVETFQRDIRYPMLLSEPEVATSLTVGRRVVRGSGLVISVLRHGSLTFAQRQALGQFRLHQFVLWGWYDGHRVSDDYLMIDPIFATLPAESLHFVVGLADGRCLAYACLQPASDRPSSASATSVMAAFPSDDAGRDTEIHRHYLAETDRPLFPTERELFGSKIFASLPALRSIPIEQMRDWACTLSNWTLRTKWDLAALLACFTAPLLLVADPAHGIDVIVANTLGNDTIVLRKIFAAFRLPVLYAPTAPAHPPTNDGYWATSVNEQGYFWPAVLARADILDHLTEIRQLDAALDLTPREVRGTFVRALRDAAERTSHPETRALRPLPDPTSMFWTDQPMLAESDGISRPIPAVRVTRGKPSSGGTPNSAPTSTIPYHANGHQRNDTKRSETASTANDNGDGEGLVTENRSLSLASSASSHTTVMDKGAGGNRQKGGKADVRVHAVRSRRDLRAWITFPRRVIYDRATPWIAPLDAELRRHIDPKRNPYFRHGKGVALLARNALGRVVGRVFAHINHRYNVRFQERVVWFGYFECIDDTNVARALIEAVRAFGVEHECRMLRGPMSLTILEDVGVTLDNFDSAPSIDAVYTAPYYPHLLEEAGLQPIFPMATFRVDDITTLNPETMLGARHHALLNAGNLRVRTLHLHTSKERDAEIELVRELINDSFEHFPYFVPLTGEEYRFAVQPYLASVDPSLLFVAELEGVPVAFMLTFPDAAPLLRRLRGHSGLLATMRVMLERQPRGTTAVGSLMGTQPQVAGLGIMRVLMAELIQALQRGGYQSLSITWAADNNDRSLAVSSPLGGHVQHHLTLYEGGRADGMPAQTDKTETPSPADPSAVDSEGAD